MDRLTFFFYYYLAPAMLTAVPTAGSSDDAMMSSATAKMNESANLMRQASSKMQTELGTRERGEGED